MRIFCLDCTSLIYLSGSQPRIGSQSYKTYYTLGQIYKPVLKRDVLSGSVWLYSIIFNIHSFIVDFYFIFDWNHPLNIAHIYLSFWLFLLSFIPGLVSAATKLFSGFDLLTLHIKGLSFFKRERCQEYFSVRSGKFLTLSRVWRLRTWNTRAPPQVGKH